MLLGEAAWDRYPKIGGWMFSSDRFTEAGNTLATSGTEGEGQGVLPVCHRVMEAKLHLLLETQWEKPCRGRMEMGSVTTSRQPARNPPHSGRECGQESARWGTAARGFVKTNYTECKNKLQLCFQSIFAF